MRAAEHHCVYVRITDCVKVPVGDTKHLITGCNSRFNEINELRTGHRSQGDIGRRFKGVVVGPGINRALGTNHCNTAISGCRRCPPRCRVNHLNYWY